MEELAKTNSRNLVTKDDIKAIDLVSLDKSRADTILSIKDSIDLTYEGSLSYGASISKNMTDFSTTLLKTVKVKEIPEVEEPLMELLTGLKSVNPDTLLEEKTGFFRRFFKGDKIEDFISRSENVSSLIEGVKNKLVTTQFTLKKDIEMFRRLMEENMKYGIELDNHIIAGRIKLNESRESLKEEEATLDTTDIVQMNEYNYHKSEIERFDRKLYDLFLMRNLVAQNVPKITLIMDGDSVLIEKIQASINSAIPAWETQMVLTIGLLRQKGALAIQKAVTKTTNDIIQKNNDMLKGNILEIGEELEKGIIDPKVLKKTNEEFIQILESLYKIKEKGREDREAAIRDLSKIQDDLNGVYLRLNMKSN